MTRMVWFYTRTCDPLVTININYKHQSIIAKHLMSTVGHSLEVFFKLWIHSLFCISTSAWRKLESKLLWAILWTLNTPTHQRAFNGQGVLTQKCPQYQKWCPNVGRGCLHPFLLTWWETIPTVPTKAFLQQVKTAMCMACHEYSCQPPPIAPLS